MGRGQSQAILAIAADNAGVVAAFETHTADASLESSLYWKGRFTLGIPTKEAVIIRDHTYGIRLSLPPDFTPSLFWT